MNTYEKLRRDSHAFRLYVKAWKAWHRAHRMLGFCRGNARNRRRYNSHIRESNRLMAKLWAIGSLPVGAINPKT